MKHFNFSLRHHNSEEEKLEGLLTHRCQCFRDLPPFQVTAAPAGLEHHELCAQVTLLTKVSSLHLHEWSSRNFLSAPMQLQTFSEAGELPSLVPLKRASNSPHSRMSHTSGLLSTCPCIFTLCAKGQLNQWSHVWGIIKYSTGTRS